MEEVSPMWRYLFSGRLGHRRLGRTSDDEPDNQRCERTRSAARDGWERMFRGMAGHAATLGPPPRAKKAQVTQSPTQSGAHRHGSAMLRSAAGRRFNES